MIMAKDAFTRKHSKKKSREYLKIFGPAIIITLIGFVVAYQFVNPAPPKKISIGTGSQTGAYYPFGKQYREILARDGITLEVLSTEGSVENIKLLETATDGVDVAFVQGGIGNPTDSPNLASLASLYFEPMWVFHRTDIPLQRLSDLRQRRIAVGPEGSGTRAIALQLLEDNAITADNAFILPIGGKVAVEALKQGDIDVAFFVASARSSVVQTLLKTIGIALMSFDRAEAYTRIHHFLSSVELPEGAIDFDSNIPSEDIVLLAPAANLVARKDIHPALVDLLLRAASEVHSNGGLFEEVHQFPSQKYLDFPLQKDAVRFFKHGPPFLQRYLPFWAATLIDRLKIMLLPLVTLLIPLMKIVPPGYRWRVRRKIFHWYRELQAVDLDVDKENPIEILDAHLAELRKIDEEVKQVTVPLSYAAELYALRIHITHVYRRIVEYRENHRT
ncbi:MAG: TAXI family TRAP transporter solute-binding subunit [Desulfobacterales bacterium]|nr:MAG: TAXI family TRAP transporter solute-binding subunit [Desulfobacterales bacterium]